MDDNVGGNEVYRFSYKYAKDVDQVLIKGITISVGDQVDIFCNKNNPKLYYNRYNSISL